MVKKSPYLILFPDKTAPKSMKIKSLKVKLLKYKMCSFYCKLLFHLKAPCLVLGIGFHSSTFFTIASTACPAAIRVSQFVLLKYINTLKN